MESGCRQQVLYRDSREGGETYGMAEDLAYRGTDGCTENSLGDGIYPWTRGKNPATFEAWALKLPAICGGMPFALAPCLSSKPL